MSESTIPLEARPLNELRPGLFDRFSRTILYSVLKRIRYGKLNIIEGDSRNSFGSLQEDFPVEATITVKCPECFGSIVLGGSVGAGESYMAGCWAADDLTNIIRIFTRNHDALQAMDSKSAWLTSFFNKVSHRLRRNTKTGSLKNIHAHYDLGNDFYALFLDRTMTYSCGFFEKTSSSLEEASIAKYDRLCRKIDLKPQDHVLEIGSGWGGFAIHAAGRYGCRVTTITISREQYYFAKSRVSEYGLEGCVEVLFQDYRDVTGTYDKLVSIEMIEAVGHENYETFFRKCASLISQTGLMALQAIVIADRYFDQAKNSVDFIKKRIFPGGCLPSVSAICEGNSRFTDLQVINLEDMTNHYPVTLRKWRENFMLNYERIRSMGYPDSFIRMWEYYLCLCEGAFAERHIGAVQVILAKPAWRI